MFLYVCREKELAKVVIRKEDVDLIVCMLFHMSCFLCIRAHFDTSINHQWIPRNIIFYGSYSFIHKKKKEINKWHKENSFFTDLMVFATRGGLMDFIIQRSSLNLIFFKTDYPGQLVGKCNVSVLWNWEKKLLMNKLVFLLLQG